MTTKTSRKRVVALGLLAPLALTIAACESDTTVLIGEDGSATLTMEIRDTQGILELGGLTTCEDFGSDFAGSEDDVIVEDISTGDRLECRISMDSGGSAVDGAILTETDTTYIFEIPEGETEDLFGTDDIELLASMGFGFTFSVDMPGAIIKADGAQIDGNRATYDDPNFIMTGISVEGNKTADGSTPSPTQDPTEDPTDDPTDDPTEDPTDDPTDDPTEEPTPVETDDGGFPTWAWILIAVVALGSIGGIVFAVTRKKDDGQGGPGGPGGFPGGPNQGGPGYGQAPYGQSGAGYGQPGGYGQGQQGYGQQGQAPYGQGGGDFGQQQTQQFAPGQQPYGHSGHPAPYNPSGYDQAPNVPQSGTPQGSYSQGGAQGGYYGGEQGAPGAASFSRGGAEGGLNHTGEFPQIDGDNPDQQV